MDNLFNNKEELNRLIQNKVEELTRKRVAEEIQLKQVDLLEKQNEIAKLQRNLTEKQQDLYKKEQEIEKQSFQINLKIKAEIDKHERDIERKQKELDRKKLEMDRELEEKFKIKEKALEIKEKDIERKSKETEERIKFEISKKEKELEDKKNLKDKKIPEIVSKAKEDIKKAQRDIALKQSELIKKQEQVLRKQKELAEKEKKLKHKGFISEETKSTSEFSVKKKKVEEAEAEAWMVTYADVITLLLTLFVFLFSVSQIDNNKLSEIQKAISVGLLKRSGDDVVGKASKGDAVFEAMKRKLQSVFERSNLGGQTKVILTDKGVKIELASSVIYSPGSADIRDEMKSAISQIADILKNSNIPDYIVIVEGHTDNNPINTAQFPSNWELSSSRATNIVRFLIDNGIPNNQLRASGYGDTRPIAPNLNEDGQSIQENQAKNRRVEIYIEKPE